MLLNEVLNLFNGDILKHVESISYDGSPEDFILNVTVYTDDDDYQGCNVHLYSDGDTCFEIDSSDDVLFIENDLLDLYSKIRETWRNSINV